MERLNMIAQIPELGLVIIGNQVDGVGVLSLTMSGEERKRVQDKGHCAVVC